VPSLATRYRCAPIRAAISPGTKEHVEGVEARDRRWPEFRAHP
jgi:hypothetical protein